MPRERTGTVWRAPDNSQLKIRLTVVDAQGKKHRPWLEIDPKFKDDAARRIATKTSMEMAGQPWDPSRFQRLKSTGTIVSCDDYFEKLWVPSRIGKLRSVRSDRYRWRKHISPLIGSRLINEITSDDLRDVVQALDAKAMRKDGKGRDRFGQKSACNCWALVSKMFGDACGSKLRELRLLKVNPAIGVKPPDVPSALEKQWLFPVELDQLLSCADIPLERRRFYAVAVYCYTRPGEVLAFLWGRSIDLEHGMVRVNRSFDHIERVFNERTKTEDSRHFALEPVLRPLLDQMWAERPKPGSLLFPRFTHLAEVLREDLMKAGVTRASLHVRRSGSQPIRFHDLRATGITYMAIRGDSDQDVRERAGHADFETTLLYIRRGHLALSSAAIGRPYAALPACVLGESSSGGGESSQKSSFSDDSIPLSKRNHSELCGAGEGIRTLDVNLGKAKKGRFTPFLSVTDPMKLAS
ncbi:MAG: tyrosine-type recombinase/integrase [Pseudomonadota bacterium]